MCMFHKAAHPDFYLDQFQALDWARSPQRDLYHAGHNQIKGKGLSQILTPINVKRKDDRGYVMYQKVLAKHFS